MTKKKFFALAGIFILGAAIMCTSVFVKKNRKLKVWDGTVYSIENVNPVDAFFARPYNRNLDKTGDLFVALMWATACSLILISFFPAKDKKTEFKSCNKKKNPQKFNGNYCCCNCCFDFRHNHKKHNQRSAG